MFYYVFNGIINHFDLDYYDLYVQPYIIDATTSTGYSYGGFEYTGIPDGIPPLEEYLAAYCSISVRITSPTSWSTSYSYGGVEQHLDTG